MKITKEYRCEKCNSVVVGGKTTFSQLQDQIKFSVIEVLDSQKKQAYREAISKLKEARDVFEQLSKKHANFKIK